MEKICIKPQTDSVKIRLRSLQLINEFIELGYNSRRKFIEIIQENLAQYRDYSSIGRLEAFWLGRVADEAINEDLGVLIDNLKNEY